MYKLTLDGDIIFPDGFILSVPYDDPRYLEYEKWVLSGNHPETIKSQQPLEGGDDA